VQATYRALRLTAAAIAIVFPLLLWAVGRYEGIPLRSCMSDYYWAAAPDQLCPCEPVDGVAKPCMEDNAVCIKEDKTKLIDPHQRRLNETNLHPGAFRNWFVGLLFAPGAILFVNRGYTKEEDYALSIAGVLAWGIKEPQVPTFDFADDVPTLSRSHGIVRELSGLIQCILDSRCRRMRSRS
jgi:hypothetical protein